MHLTPLDVQQMVFRTKFRGYDREEVNRFLEELAQTVEALNRDNAQLRERMMAYSQKDDEVASLKEALTLQAQIINALKAQLDELTGSQPRAATKGYRASQADETVVKQTSRVAGSKPTVDPGFLDYAIGPKS